MKKVHNVKVQAWDSEKRGRENSRPPFVTTLVKQTKASDFHIHEVCFVAIPCQINWGFNVQCVWGPSFQTLTIYKTRYQRAAHTQFHEPINTAFALITNSAPWKEWQELSERCSLLPGFIWWKWISCSSQIQGSPKRTSYHLRECGCLLPESSSNVLLATLGCWLSGSFVWPAFCRLEINRKWASPVLPLTLCSRALDHQWKIQMSTSRIPHRTRAPPMPNDVAWGLWFSEAELNAWWELKLHRVIFVAAETLELH